MMGDTADTIEIEWEGIVCPECSEEYEHSPTNNVSVLKFDYCPNCGADLPEEARVSETRSYKPSEMDY